MEKITRESIIQTALEIWGEDGFKNMSLSPVSKKLHISKAALYKHFKNKADLLKEMKDSFLLHLFQSIDQAAETTDSKEDILHSYISHIVQYFSQNHYLLDFYNIVLSSIKNIRLSDENFQIGNHLFLRFSDYLREQNSWLENENIKYFIFYVFHSVIVYLSFQFKLNGINNLLNREKVSQYIDDIEDIVTNGFFHVKPAGKIDFHYIESICSLEDKELPVRNKLLKAIADVVAEEGIWNTSTDKIAQKLGMAKSSLYHYFADKNEMIAKMLNEEVIFFLNLYRTKLERLDHFFERLYGDIYITYQNLSKDLKHLKVLNWLHCQNISVESFFELFQQRYEMVYRENDQELVKCYKNPTIFPSVFLQYQISEYIIMSNNTENLPNKNILRVIYRLFINGYKEDISCQ